MGSAVEIIQSKIPHQIFQWIESDSLIFVRTDTSEGIARGDSTYDQNIYAFDKSAKLIWRVEAIAVARSPKSFTSMKYVDGKLTAHNWIGGDYQIDLSNGSLTNLRPNTRPW
jgi:hypothetical protein